MHALTLLAFIDSYFQCESNFNPETMNPSKVKELIAECRAFVSSQIGIGDFPSCSEERERECHETLRECKHEIVRLRRTNEILSAKVEVMDLFAQTLNTKPAERIQTCSPDVIFQIAKRLEGL